MSVPVGLNDYGDFVHLDLLNQQSQNIRGGDAAYVSCTSSDAVTGAASYIKSLDTVDLSSWNEARHAGTIESRIGTTFSDQNHANHGYQWNSFSGGSSAPVPITPHPFLPFESRAREKTRAREEAQRAGDKETEGKKRNDVTLVDISLEGMLALRAVKVKPADGENARSLGHRENEEEVDTLERGIFHIEI